MTDRSEYLRGINPDEPNVDENAELNWQTKHAVRRVINPIRDKYRAQAMARQRAYDLANPPAEADKRAADKLRAEIAELEASGRGGSRLDMMRYDLRTLEERIAGKPPQTVPTQWSMRKSYPIERLDIDCAEHDPEVEGLIITGTRKQVVQQVRGAQKAAQSEIARRADGPKVRVSDLIDEEEEEMVAAVQKRMAR